MHRVTGIFALLAFMASIPAANWLIGHVGYCSPSGPCVIPVGFGLMAPSGVLMIGAALVLRDLVQHRMGAWWTIGAIVAGAAVSFFLAQPALALASGVAFLMSEAADMAVYTPLYRRRFFTAVAASSVVGAAIDSAAFLYLAFGSINYLPGQLLGKLWMVGAATLALWTIRRWRTA